MSILVIFLFVNKLKSETNTCVMTSSTGCIYSNSYDFETQFVCGAMQAGNVPPIYDKATQGCCNQGVPYSKSQEFCCSNEIYPMGSGQCVKWVRADVEKFPECYDCTDNPTRKLSYKDFMIGLTTSPIDEIPLENQQQQEEQEKSIIYEEKFIPNPNYLRANQEEKIMKDSDVILESKSKPEPESKLELEPEPELNQPALSPTPVHIDRKLATWPTSDPFDTIANGPSPTPCTLLDDKVGCYNSYQYFYVTHYPCYNYLLTWSVYGCCDGIPYRHQSQTCCYLDGQYVVKNSNTWCTCQSYQCEPSAAPTKTLITKKPTRTPTTRPTHIPTISFSPTTAIPTDSPTISFKPTPAQIVKLSANNDDEVFHAEYIYGGGAFLFVGLVALIYFQSKASRLIAERHRIVLEIDEAT